MNSNQSFQMFHLTSFLKRFYYYSSLLILVAILLNLTEQIETNLLASPAKNPSHYKAHPSSASAGRSRGRSWLASASELGPEAESSNVIQVKIGALLEETDLEQANMFIRTIKLINERRDESIRKLMNLTTTLAEESDAKAESSQGGEPKRFHLMGAQAQQSRLGEAGQLFKFEPVIEFLSDKHNTLEADSKVCQFIESGVHGLFGPRDGLSIQHVQSICDNMEIPYFELRPNLSYNPRAIQSVVHNQLAASQPDLPATTRTKAQELSSSPELSGNNNRLAAMSQDIVGPSSGAEDSTLNLFPPAHLLTQAYIDLIYTWNWTSFALVYEDGSSLIKLQDLFRESSGTWTSKWQIKLFQFTNSNSPQHRLNQSKLNHLPEEEPDAPSASTQDKVPRRRSGSNRKSAVSFRDIFWKIKSSGETNILLDVKTEHLFEALKNAQQVGCMTEKYSYLITSLDLHTIDLEDFKYSRTRITSFNLIQVYKSERIQQRQSGLGFDERYLEKLGIRAAPSVGQQPEAATATAATVLKSNEEAAAVGAADNINSNQRWPKFKLSPSIVLDKAGPFMDPPSDVYTRDHNQWLRSREQLVSNPASMSLLPSLDRDNEHMLFDFFIGQQEKNISRVRLSTASAILHDSLLLYALGLSELLDSNGHFSPTNGERQFRRQQPDYDSSHAHAGDASCSLGPQHTWLHGSSLINYMRRITFTGLTGLVSFDQAGFRSDFKLDMMGMAPDIGLIKVGEWHSSPGKSVQFNRQIQEESLDESALAKLKESAKSYEELSKLYERELKNYQRLLSEGKPVLVPYRKLISSSQLRKSSSGNNILFNGDGKFSAGLFVNEIIFDRLYKEQSDQIDTLIVTTKLSQPYFMLKETPNKLEHNDQYEGFAVDLIHELSKLVNFKYRWREVEDKKYGSKEALPNGTIVWNGMIGEIVRGEADLAIVDLTITAQREEAVDFTLPFMNTGISILFKKPTTKVTTLFSFLSPFSSDVWAYVLAAYCGISAILFFVGHLSPYEWADPHPCRHSARENQMRDGNQEEDLFSDFRLYKDEKILKNQFSLLNSFWFTIGSLMQQGSDLTPRSMSTRTIAGIWYFFTLIMISSYTANLAAFLTVEKVVYPIENVRDLSNQQEIKYGCVESGSTCTFFHDSQIDTYKRINETMRKFRTYVKSNDEGQKRVEEGKFAFFMESASIEYIVERNCNLTQIGGLLDSKGYGLATSKKSRLKRPYRTLLSEGILHLQETGMLHILKNRWWKERRGGGTCTDDGKGGGVTELSLANVGGVFVVLLGGLGISFLVAIAEFMWRARRNGSTRDRMCDEMMNDLKFALACKRSTKPVKLMDEDQRVKLKQTVSKGTRRQLARQQSSLNLQVQQPQQLVKSNKQKVDNDPALAATRQAVEQYGKDCDPILLHAMLTMMMQQQPTTGAQQQVQAASVRPVMQHETSHYHHELDLQQQRRRQQLDHQMRNNKQSELDLEAKKLLKNGAGNSNASQYNWPAPRDNGPVAALATSSLNKRRCLLFAQQTIDDE